MLLFVLACSESTPLPEGLEPLEENQAPWPDIASETVAFATGETPDYDWAHARGYVHAPLATVEAVLLEQDVGVDRRAVDEWETEDTVCGEGLTCWLLHNTVHDTITVEFTNEWRLGDATNDDGDVDLVAARFGKVEGSTVISLLLGSLQAFEVEDGVTAVETIEHLASIRSDTTTITSTLGDLHASIVARAHGEALPMWE